MMAGNGEKNCCRNQSPPSLSLWGYSYKFNSRTDHANKKGELKLKGNHKYIFALPLKNHHVNYSLIECPMAMAS